MSEYHVNVFYSEVDKSYIADIPELKFCSAFGSTPAEAVREVQLAKAAWIKAAIAAGEIIPQPRYQPVILSIPDKR